MTGRWAPVRSAAAVAGLVLAGAALAGCATIEGEEAGTGYEPSSVEETDAEVERVTFTADGADRVGLQSAVVRSSGKRSVLDHAALIYDGQGKPWVYAMEGPLTFLRHAVVVERIDGDRVVVTEGPAPGTRVVTVGASEVYGTELGMASNH